jgi:hypothetical protein
MERDQKETVNAQARSPRAIRQYMLYSYMDVKRGTSLPKGGVSAIRVAVSPPVPLPIIKVNAVRIHCGKFFTKDQ